MKLVFESMNGEDLFTAKSMRAICDLEDKFVTPYMEMSGLECRMHSLPFYIATLNNKCCHEIRQTDMEKSRQLLQLCAPYYHNSTLKEQCWQDLCPTVPSQCYQFGAVFKILNYMTDVGFYGKDTKGNGQPKLTYSMMIFDNYVDDVLDYYRNDLEGKNLKSDLVKIVAVYNNIEVKFDLFSDYLMKDLRFFALAMGLILVILMFYLLSISLMIATIINVGLSFTTSYFIYNVILGIEFFPFMNLLGGLILIAVGADDVFIFYDTWRQVTMNDPDLPMELIVDKTFKHAALSIFVTSLTTSAAFFANYVSSIAAIRCFGLFAGIAVLANFFFMVTWTPSIIVIIEHLSRIVYRATPNFERKWKRMCEFIKSRWEKMYSKLHKYAIAKVWWGWILLYLGLGIAGMVVVFYKPRLQLPHSKELQLFPSNHPMEFFDQQLRDKFQYLLDEEESNAADLQVYYTWGFKSEDNGDWLDPTDDGHLEKDYTFNLTQPTSQTWINDFCKDLKKQDFVDDDVREKDSLCFMDGIEQIFAAYCPQIVDVMPVCCQGNKSAPYDSQWLETCLPVATAVSKKLHTHILGNVIYDKNNIPAGFMLQISIKEHISTSYDKMNKIFHELDDFLKEKSKSAPTGMKAGWFTGKGVFMFYDLQQAISHGTYYSIMLSIGVATIVMLFTSLNVLITVYAIFTIVLAIAVTVGSIVLMGWELNILESVTISLAVGLSIDFTIHYGIAFRLSKEKDQKDRVHESFVHVGPAVAMAALTTFAAGAAMMPCRVVVYIKLGIFLMLVMTISWLYATFFFQSVCYVIGPRGNTCQIPLPCAKRREEELNMEDLNMDPDNYDDVDELLLTM